MLNNGVQSMEVAQLPRLNEPAPDFEAVTTQGTLRLSDFAGRWVILFSHPADFTPVCTTEFIAFSEIYPELQKRNVDLLGLSIDSVYSHIAWIRNIEERFGVKVPFPVIADLNKEVATLYGMVMPGESKTETARCVFMIDDKRVLRAMIYYPLSTGRNMREILRVIDALQTADHYAVATPANWMPGDKVIMAPPKTVDMATERVTHAHKVVTGYPIGGQKMSTGEHGVKAGENGYECIDWYLCKKELPALHSEPVVTT
ncbi:MAG: peroxiredoxin [Caldilineaceae bacterium]|nr:peroxiredoxin [Caldilineaceae bacterium]